MRLSIFALPLFLATSAIIGDEAVDLPEENKFSNPAYHSRDHRFFLGLDGFWIHQKLEASRNWLWRSSGFEYNELSGGIRAGYDHIAPNDYYFGYEGMIAFGSGRITLPGNRQVTPYKRTTLTAFEEARVGYNFAAGHKRWVLAPYLGAGMYEIRNMRSHVSETMLYGALGVRGDYAISPTFDLGLYLKGFRSFYWLSHVKFRMVEYVKASNGKVLKKRRTVVRNRNLNNTWGYEIDLPITLRLSRNSPWDIQAQPYFIRLNTNVPLNITGLKLSVGYSF